MRGPSAPLKPFLLRFMLDGLSRRSGFDWLRDFACPPVQGLPSAVAVSRASRMSWARARRISSLARVRLP